MPFKFLFVSYDGLIGDTAWQVTKEGHEAKYYIEHEEERGVAHHRPREGKLLPLTAGQVHAPGE